MRECECGQGSCSCSSPPGNVDYGTPTPAESSVLSKRQPTTDLAEQVLAVIGRHGNVVRERAQQADVALGVVVDRPVEVLDRDHIALPGPAPTSRTRSPACRPVALITRSNN